MADINEQILEQIKRLENFCRVAPDAVTPEALIIEDLRIDSLGKVDLFLEIEQHFNIDIYDEEVDETESIQELIDLIARKQGSKELVS